MEHFLNREKIGEGSYGVVYRAQDSKTGQFVALKNIRQFPGEEGVPSTAIREISLLRELKHPNIVALLDVLIADNSIYMILEYLPMDLRQYLNALPANQLMDKKLVSSYLYQTTSAILFCHRRRVMHRDLTPQNLLIDASGIIKIADFGLSRYFHVPVRMLTHEVVTLWYRAPEILLGSPLYACPVDIWAIGCIFFEMSTGKPLFDGESEIDQIFRIFRMLGTPNEDNWPGVTAFPDYKTTFPYWPCNKLTTLINSLGSNDATIDLLANIIVYNPALRLTAEEILEHAYFKGADQDEN